MVFYQFEQVLPLLVEKENLNIRNSTGADVVAVNYCMSDILQTRHWLDAKGYNVFERIVYQNNESAILLENNDRAPSSNHTMHKNIRLYFVTYCIEKMNSYYNGVPHQT